MQDKLSVSLYIPGAILRPWKVEDATWYVEARDEEVFRFTAERRDLTVQETEAAIQRVNASEDIISWVIVDSSTHELLGNIAIDFQQADAYAEGHYFLAQVGRGRGIATNALKTVCEWVFANLAVERIILNIYPDNLRSQRVAQRVGFRQLPKGVSFSGRSEVIWFELRKPNNYSALQADFSE